MCFFEHMNSSAVEANIVRIEQKALNPTKFDKSTPNLVIGYDDQEVAYLFCPARQFRLGFGLGEVGQTPPSLDCISKLQKLLKDQGSSLTAKKPPKIFSLPDFLELINSKRKARIIGPVVKEIVEAIRDILPEGLNICEKDQAVFDRMEQNNLVAGSPDVEDENAEQTRKGKGAKRNLAKTGELDEEADEDEDEDEEGDDNDSKNEEAENNNKPHKKRNSSPMNKEETAPPPTAPRPTPVRSKSASAPVKKSTGIIFDMEMATDLFKPLMEKVENRVTNGMIKILDIIKPDDPTSVSSDSLFSGLEKKWKAEYAKEKEEEWKKEIIEKNMAKWIEDAQIDVKKDAIAQVADWKRAQEDEFANEAVDVTEKIKAKYDELRQLDEQLDRKRAKLEAKLKALE